MADKFYANITTGNTTKQIVLANSTLTSGVVPIATTDGNLTDGPSVAVMSANTSFINLTASQANMINVTTPNDGVKHSYLVGGFIVISSVLTNTVKLSVSFTDNVGASRTLDFFPEGLTSALLGTTGAFSLPPTPIYCNPNTAITVNSTVTGAGSIAYASDQFLIRMS